MVYVFKTSIKYKYQIKDIGLQLDSITQIIKWNFDLQDCDKILRIEGTNLDIALIYKILESLNYTCLELA
jgi:hypothetical protein